MRGGGGGSFMSFLMVIVMLGGGYLFLNAKGGEEGAVGGLGSVIGAISNSIGGALDSANEELVARHQENNKESRKKSGEASGSYDEATFYEELGEAKITNPELPSGEIEYKEVDSRGRAQGAYGMISYENYADYKKRGRHDINDDPAGWGGNKQVTIVGVGVDGEEERYHGWMYNRSHLIADSLGGHPEIDNLITGTRMQNVGWNDGTGGMGYIEDKIRDFVKDNHDCDVYYSVEPNYYSDNELIPKTVTVDARSCNNEINERIAVYNVAPGYEIDYTNGKFTKVKN